MERTNSVIAEYYRSVMDIAKKARADGLVLYGAGFWGGITERIFNIFGVSPVAFCDDDTNKQGRFFSVGSLSDTGTPIMTLDKAAMLYPNAVYIATVTSGINAPRTSMNKRLKARGLLSANSGFHPSRYIFLLEEPLDELEASPSLENGFRAEHFRNLIVLKHMSNSGSILFSSLLDGHRNIISINLFGSFVQLKDLYEQRLKHLEGLELVIEIVSQMTPFLISRYDGESIYTPELNLTRFHSDEHGEPETRILISGRIFTQKLYSEIAERGSVTFAILIKAIFAAYANSIGQRYTQGEDYWLFLDYHRVSSSFAEIDALVQPKDFEHVEYWFIIREPVQQWFSWLKRFIADEGADETLRLWAGRTDIYQSVLSCDLGIAFEKSPEMAGKIVRIIRFEDLKRQMEGLLRAVCSILGLLFEDNMLEPTVNGIPVYFPASNKLISKAVFAASDNTALNRSDFSSLMTSYDIFRLNVAFRRFKLAFGYDCDVPDEKSFSDAFLKDMYVYPFKFESVLDKAIAEASEIGYLLPDEHPFCHDYIAELFISNLRREHEPEFFSDIIKPLDV